MIQNFLKRTHLDKKDYIETVENIISSLDNNAKEKSSLLIYGSFIKNTFNPGISDLDGILYFEDKFVLNKAMLKKINLELSEFKKSRSFYPELDLTILDAGNSKDGRFLSYNENIMMVFKSNKNSKLTYGKNFVNKMSPVYLTDPTETRLSMNLEALRKYLVFKRNSSNLDFELNSQFNCFQYIRRLGVKVATLLEEKDLEKKEGIEYLISTFPSINFSALKEIETNFNNINSLRNFLIDNKENAVKLIEEGTECYELVLKKITEEHPAKGIKNSRT